MKITYDKEMDAAYIYLKYLQEDSECKKTKELNENLIVDFDAKERLLGIEVLNAGKSLLKALLSEAITMEA